MAGFDELKQRHRAMWASGDDDRTPELLDAAQRRAAEQGCGKVRWGREDLITLATRG